MPTETIVAIILALGSVATAALAFWSKFHATELEAKKHKAESDAIDLILTQRNEAFGRLKEAEEHADQADAERNDALDQVNQSIQEIERLTNQVQVLRLLVNRLGASLDLARAEIAQLRKMND